MTEEMTALFRSGDRENIREKAATLRNESDNKVLAVLTSDQKRQLADPADKKVNGPRSSASRPVAMSVVPAW